MDFLALFLYLHREKCTIHQIIVVLNKRAGFRYGIFVQFYFDYFVVRHSDIICFLKTQKILNSKIIHINVCYNSILAYILHLLSHNTVLYIFQQKRLISIFLYRKNRKMFNTAVYLVSDSYNLVEQVSNLYKIYNIVHLFYHLEISYP